LALTCQNPNITDLHLHDTYFILATQSLKIWLCGYLLLVTLMYKVIRWKQGFVHKWMIITHLISLALAVLLLVLPGGWLGLADVPERYIDYASLGRSNQLMVVWLALVLIVPLIFLAYFIAQLARPRPLAL
jgi:heme/copper-type cytochrome/quinol oxidase subunit 1